MSNRIQAGENFSLTDDAEILEINSPKHRVDGPYVVVHKDSKKRWAIVAMEWTHGHKTEPVLGIRWFHDKVGNPQSRGYPTWCVLPNQLAPTGLIKLLSPKFSHLINSFLEGKIMGGELHDKWYNS